MFNGITLASFILLFVVAASAQESPSNKILNRFELVAGPSVSKNKGYLPDHDSRTGYSVGVGYYQKLSKSFYLNFRTLYESKGTAATYRASVANMDGSSVNIQDKYTSEFKYLTFYLLPTLKLAPKKNIHIGAGGYYSFLRRLSVTSHRTNHDTGELIWYNTRTDESFFTPNYDAGVTFQIGYSFKVNDKCRLMLQAFSNRGLVDLHSNWIGSHRNNNFGLLLSFKMQ
jgi:hypothetical protein